MSNKLIRCASGNTVALNISGTIAMLPLMYNNRVVSVLVKALPKEWKLSLSEGYLLVKSPSPLMGRELDSLLEIASPPHPVEMIYDLEDEGREGVYRYVNADDAHDQDDPEQYGIHWVEIEKILMDENLDSYEFM